MSEEIRMVVSGGAVSPENRSNEEKVAALARWLDYQFESPSIGNQVRSIGARLAEVESERDAALAQNVRLLARIAAVEAQLQPSALFDALYDAMYGQISVSAEEREAVAQLAESLAAALAASPTPTTEEQP